MDEVQTQITETDVEQVCQQINELEADARHILDRIQLINRGILRRSVRGRAIPPELFTALDRRNGELNPLYTQLSPLYELRRELIQAENQIDLGYVSAWELTIDDVRRIGAPVSCLIGGEFEDDQQIFFVDDDLDGRRPGFSPFDIRPEQKLSGWGYGLKEAINDTLTEAIGHVNRLSRF